MRLLNASAFVGRMLVQHIFLLYNVLSSLLRCLQIDHIEARHVAEAYQVLCSASYVGLWHNCRIHFLIFGKAFPSRSSSTSTDSYKHYPLLALLCWWFYGPFQIFCLSRRAHHVPVFLEWYVFDPSILHRLLKIVEIIFDLPVFKMSLCWILTRTTLSNGVHTDVSKTSSSLIYLFGNLMSQGQL